MTDLEVLNYFLGIFATRLSTGLFLSQKKYALQNFERAHMVACNPSWTPVDTEAKLGLDGYTDADCAGCPSSRRSTSGYCVSWLIIFCQGPLNGNTLSPTLVLKPNTGVLLTVIYMSANLVQHQRAKPIEIVIHFVRDMVTAGDVHVLYVPSRFQYADIFTKGLPSALFEEFRSSLSVHHPPAQTAKTY
uniref:Uncharacterized protein n=1 Tax=Tanacetum cinerariifolium TaxID=118510 RepID=A0A699L8S7_TANCI|nr:hypothetical protein [Tanacetum cinerariifolium]